MNRLLLAVSLVLFGGAQAIAGVDSMDLGSTSVDSTGGGTVTVTGASSGDLQGFVISVSHDSAVITLDSIDILGTDADIAGAEFVVCLYICLCLWLWHMCTCIIVYMY